MLTDQLWWVPVAFSVLGLTALAYIFAAAVKPTNLVVIAHAHLQSTALVPVFG